MGYIINTLKAIFGKSEPAEIELDEQKLLPEEKKLLEIMRRDDNTSKLENNFVQSLSKVKPITPGKTNNVNVKGAEEAKNNSERDER